MDAIELAVSVFTHVNSGTFVRVEMSQTPLAASGKISPMVEISMAIKDDTSPNTLNGGVRVIADTVFDKNGSKVEINISHTTLETGLNERSPKQWQDLQLAPEQISMSLDKQILIAMNRASGIMGELEMEQVEGRQLKKGGMGELDK